MKNITPGFTWKVKLFDVNSHKIIDYDILEYREEKIKKFKKTYRTFEAFADALQRDLMYQFWSRSEYELLIGYEDSMLCLWPWIFEADRYIIPKDSDFDWTTFAAEFLSTKAWFNGKAKIDVWDQINFRFGEFARFCWHFRHKYQRSTKQ